MAESMINQLFCLLKQQDHLQEKLKRQLLKTETLLTFSKKVIQSQIQAMMKLLPNLPLAKQKELKKIVELICDHPEVGMVILFGSYARGDWVEDYEADGIHFKYQSDFDLLVIVSETCKASEQKKLEQSLFKAIQDLSSVKTPVSILVHDILFINNQLKKSQYFFSDIQSEGIRLYDSGKFILEKAAVLDKKQRYELAKKDFDYWFLSANDFYEVFKFCFRKKKYNQAAFQLHQATERLYTCILLVFTRYKPNTHKLDILRKLTNALDKRLITVFPLSTTEETHRFTLLCDAYVEARYNKNYSISKADLVWLEKKIAVFKDLTEKLCQEKIESFLPFSNPSSPEKT